jgi:hypothetical protein
MNLHTTANALDFAPAVSSTSRTMYPLLRGREARR